MTSLTQQFKEFDCVKLFSNYSQTIPPLNRRRGEGFKAPYILLSTREKVVWMGPDEATFTEAV